MSSSCGQLLVWQFLLQVYLLRYDTPLWKAPRHVSVWAVQAVHYRSMYTVCTAVLSTVGETATGTRVGFGDSDKVLAVFLFIYVSLTAIWLTPGGSSTVHIYT
jgi:hypothetical protein